VKRSLALLLLALGCDTPADGVQRIAFLLEPPPPSETRVVPPEMETGISPAVLGQARGRCAVDVVARAVRCSFQGLPPESASKQPLAYELRFLLWYVPLPAGFDARTIDRDPGGRDPDAPPPPMTPPLPRASGGRVAPDPFGVAERTLTAPDIPLDRIAGGEILLAVPRADATTASYLVIDGRVGNLRSTGDTAAPPPAPTTGHQH
jgi:hypothetical protein